MNKKKVRLLTRLITICIVGFLGIGRFINENGESLFNQFNAITKVINSENTSATASSALSNIPDYDHDAVYIINDNQPFFTDEEKQDTDSRIELSELDPLGRCGVAKEVISKEMFPREERKDISAVYPTGWHQAQYGDVYVYNRTHLLGFLLSGLNDDERNLITATTYMNQDVMADYELDIKAYVNATGNHVVYRVTPDFKGDNLVAKGVQIEAWSVEDNGEGICLNIYLYNVQAGVAIDYETGYTSSSDYIQDDLKK